MTQAWRCDCGRRLWGLSKYADAPTCPRCRLQVREKVLFGPDDVAVGSVDIPGAEVAYLSLEWESEHRPSILVSSEFDLSSIGAEVGDEIEFTIRRKDDGRLVLVARANVVKSYTRVRMTPREIWTEWRRGCGNTVGLAPWRCWFCTWRMGRAWIRAVVRS